MEERKLLVLLQLVRGIQDNFSVIEKAYNNSEKEKFDSAKAAILDLQKKIGVLLK